MKKRVIISIAVFLTLVFCIGHVSVVPVYAEGSEAVAMVTAGDVSTEYTDIIEAVAAWNEAGAGAKLTFLTNILTDATYVEAQIMRHVIRAAGGTEEQPMILDLNGYGIVYTGSQYAVIILVDRGAHLKITDSRSDAVNYILKSGNRGVGVSDSQPESSYVTVNGGFISGSLSDSPAIRNSGSFELEGGTIAANTGTFIVYNEGTFKMSGGIICNNTGNNGGGVYNYGSFYMSGGAINNNSGNNGGVKNFSNFEMTGGTISGNTPRGVLNMDNSTFTMSGTAVISGNSGTNLGGGVCNQGKTFIMNGGIIENNSAKYGGGVYNYSGTFQMNDGIIRGNTASSPGGGVFNNSRCVISGGVIKNNSAFIGSAVYDQSGVTLEDFVFAGDSVDGSDAAMVETSTASSNLKFYGYVEVIKPEARVTSGETSINYLHFSEAETAWKEAGAGAILTLLKNVTVENSIEVNGGSADSPMVLDLYDHGILYVGEEEASVIRVDSGCCLELKDSLAESGTERFISRNESSGRGIAVNDTKQSDGDIEVQGGYIAGGTGTAISDSVYGGGVLNQGTFTMSSGTIAANAAGLGSGIANIADPAIPEAAVTFNMTGGTITGNKAGVHGGVYIMGCAFSLSGSPVISDNVIDKDGGTADENIYLAANTLIDVSNLSEGKFGVQMEVPGVFTAGAAFASDTAAMNVFTSEDSEYYVSATEEQQAQLEEVPEQYICVTGVSGSFQDMIRLNFYFKDPHGFDPSGAFVKLSGGEDDRIVPINFDEAIQAGDGVYIFSIPLYANEGCDKIAANVYDAGGNSVAVKGSSGVYYFENELQYSLLDYFTVLEYTGATDTIKALGAAAKDYCSAAQIYFKYSNYEETVISDKINAVTADTLAAYTSVRSGTKPAELTVKGISAMIEEDNTLRVYLTSTGNFTYKVDDEIRRMKIKPDGSTYLARTEGTAANELHVPHFYRVLNSSGTELYSIEASVLTYARSCIRSSNTDLQNLGKAMYLYNRAAVDEFGDPLEAA